MSFCSIHKELQMVVEVHFLSPEWVCLIFDEKYQFLYLLMYLWGRLSITEGNSSNILRTILKLMLYPPPHISTLSRGILSKSMTNDHWASWVWASWLWAPWVLASRRSSPFHREARPVAWSALVHLGSDPCKVKVDFYFEDFDFIKDWDHDIELDKIVYKDVEDCLKRLSKNCHLIDPESILGLFPGCSILAFLLSIRLKV